MSEHTATIETTENPPETSPGRPAGPAPQRADAAPEQPVVALQDLLVEEVSIDGMCGVY